MTPSPRSPRWSFARLRAASAHRHQPPAALRRIANNGEPHSGQWPSQPGRPFGKVTSRGSAMVTFWPQTHQPCGPGSCTSSVCGSTMCDKHISWLRGSYAGRASRGCRLPRPRAPATLFGASALAPEASPARAPAGTPARSSVATVITARGGTTATKGKVGVRRLSRSVSHLSAESRESNGHAPACSQGGTLLPPHVPTGPGPGSPVRDVHRPPPRSSPAGSREYLPRASASA